MIPQQNDTTDDFGVELYDRDKIADIEKELSINEISPDRDMAVCAMRYHHYTQLAADADMLHEKSTFDREVYEAQMTQMLRTTHAEMASRVCPDEDGKVKRVKVDNPYEKEADLKRAYMRDEMWVALRNLEIQNAYNARVLKGMAKAFEMKSMLIQSYSKRQLFKEGQGISRPE